MYNLFSMFGFYVVHLPLPCFTCCIFVTTFIFIVVYPLSFPINNSQPNPLSNRHTDTTPQLCSTHTLPVSPPNRFFSEFLYSNIWLTKWRQKLASVMQHKILMPLRSALRRYLLLGTDFTIGDYSHKIQKWKHFQRHFCISLW